MSPSARFTHAIERLVLGEHPDPFGFLGLHGEGSGHTLRVFRPGAVRVAALDRQSGRELGELERLHAAGLFAKRFAKPIDYRLRVETAAGAVREIEDPYRFGPVLGEIDLHLLGEGTHARAYDILGAHLKVVDGVAGTAFAVWAPNAKRVSVIGDFNDWDGRIHPMRLHPGVGIWDIFLPGVGQGDVYKYELLGPDGRKLAEKSDPFGFYAEAPPKSASVVWPLRDHHWGDGDWMASRAQAAALDQPVSIYEVHLGSWRKRPEEGNRRLTYRELAHELGDYVRDLGFTHVELMPVHEHPFDGSWGYQPIGLFAPTSRYGTPDDFCYFVDHLHRLGIGVIIDWVAGHFPGDAHGLAWFDGTHLYEHADPRKGRHRDWDTLIYNYGRNEVSNFLLANALFWMETYHIDGLRVDAVASMLYLDYSRQPGDWLPNRYGGKENIEAIDFLRRMNEMVYGGHPGVMTVAEESTSWPMVSRPTYLGGLGFGYKWNMGWMHDTLRYMSKEPIHRRYHHDDLTFGLLYAFHENFVLPISHDEVVHGKGSLLGRMPGDRWQRFANLRAYFGFMFTMPGKKLLFMGCEFGQEAEWNHDVSLDWHLLADPLHRGVQSCLRDLNRLYRECPALYEHDCEGAGFAWIDCNDRDNSVLSYARAGKAGNERVLVVCNFTPVVREGYRVGVPKSGIWEESLNTDSGFYGGSNVGNAGWLYSEPVAWHGQSQSLALRLPPLATVILRWRPA
ncbi:MAG: 1,4-alpha-glucan branching protein GlgB [Rhodospirillales bacterium]|nr:1,4-alpha-glucan branching protein GlgB [Rhodospirillales bacterium]